MRSIRPDIEPSETDIRTAREVGMTPEQVRDLVDIWAEHAKDVIRDRYFADEHQDLTPPTEV